MKNSLKKISTVFPGGAVYNIARENSVNFLLGLGLWDRENEPHTLKVKNQTKGQVVRLDPFGKILARSPALNNLIYQLQPVDDEKIFVGCRDSHLYYLNPDLSIQRKINIPGSGLYFWKKVDDLLIATMREGSLLFFNLKDDSFEILPIVEKKVRMWALLVDKDLDQIICGSYDGDLVIVQDRKVVNKIKISPNRKKNSVWAIEKFKNQYWIGTADGSVFFFDKNLSERKLVHCSYVDNKICGITSSTPFGDQIIFGDIHGNLHIFNEDLSVIDFDFQIKCKTPNTIWWIDANVENDLIRVAYSNGSLETFEVL